MDRTNELQVLKAKVAAFREEVEKLIGFHETWRPMVSDAALHERMGRSYATNTFNTIRAALRREVLLGLVRLWDNHKSAVNLENIGHSLSDMRNVDGLVQECISGWATPPSTAEQVPGSDATLERRALERYCAHMRTEMTSTLQRHIDEALALIAKYKREGPGYALRQELTTQRNQWLAHRQVTPSVVPGSERIDDEVEEFYQDMLRLVVVLAHTVQHTAYNPSETANIRRRHAQFFWNGIRGERTEGHPDYKGPRTSYQSEYNA